MKAASFHEKRDGWAGRRTHLSGGGATLLSSHAGRSFTPAAGKTAQGQPRRATSTQRARRPAGRTHPPHQRPCPSDTESTHKPTVVRSTHKPTVVRSTHKPTV